MLTLRAGGLAALILGSLIAGPAAADDIQAKFYTSDDTLLRIGQFTFEGGKTLNLTVGIGSGAWRGPKDPANVIWTVGDRGPNIACSEIKADRRHRVRALQGRAERPRLSDAVLQPVDLSRDAARQRHLPRHRRHHPQGPRRQRRSPACSTR